ncbi:MAG: hypothetical protein ACI9SB_000952 [Candidatus Azotimanducaceae bacterium]|jgi:hypothetical protein
MTPRSRTSTLVADSRREQAFSIDLIKYSTNPKTTVHQNSRQNEPKNDSPKRVSKALFASCMLMMRIFIRALSHHTHFSQRYWSMAIISTALHFFLTMDPLGPAWLAADDAGH